MKKQKFNPELLKEELNRIKVLENFKFYQDEVDDYGKEKPLILGTDLELEEADEEPNDGADAPNPDMEADIANIGDELGLSDEDPNNGGEIPQDDMGGEQQDDEDMDFTPDANQGGGEIPDLPTEPEAPADDEVEIDVTSIVKGTEEAKAAAKRAADAATRTAQELMSKLDGLEARLSKMDAVTAKIDGLEKEIIKRNPTPVEKLEMRSLDSYPFNQKLSDYWSDKEGAYDVMNNKEKEYTLTQDDIDSDYSYSQMKDSFDVNPEDYEEEDI